MEREQQSGADALRDASALPFGGMNVDLSQAVVRKALADRIAADMDKYVAEKYPDDFRNHLGASLIGADCTRQSWYSWRWFAKPNHTGRMRRLFRRGHREEAWFIEMLRGTGAEVWEHDPSTGKQFQVSRLNGHFGGSLDSIIRLPASYGVPHDLLFLGEYKTKGTGKGFNDLKTKGIMLANPQHYDQMCTYGANYGYGYSVYFSVNKNDDDLHVEIVPLNTKRAAEVESKAQYIIAQRSPPPRISMTPEFYKCKGCDFHGICHLNHVPAKNCRSCKHSVPADAGSWYCQGHGATIPEHVIRQGCQHWNFIQ